jgi:hypothetical protein
MVKLTTTEGLEVILEKKFPCVLNHISEPKIEISNDPISGEIVNNMETTVEIVLYSTEKIELDNNDCVDANTIYDIRESADYVMGKLLEEGIEFTAYNLE